jgi:phage N-6-adenine-methyltransferase
MKANNGSGNIESRDEWETPLWLFQKINLQYKFDHDCCASEKNHKCKSWDHAFEEEGMDLDFTCWMNPPFSKAFEMFEHFFKVVRRGVAIYRCDNMETKVWQEVILKKADWIFIFNKRISYEGFNGNGSRFPSALIGIGVEPPINLEGKVLFLTKTNGGKT